MSSALGQPKISLGSSFSTTSQMKLSSLLLFLIACMIISATKPETAEWMDHFMSVPIIILQNMLMKDVGFKCRGLTLERVLNDLREGVRRHKNSGKRFGIYAYLTGQNPSFTLSDEFFVFFNDLVHLVFSIPEHPQVMPQVEPKKQCWCDGFSKKCVCARKNCYCQECIKSPCNRFLPAIQLMQSTAYAFLRNISCISFFLSFRLPKQGNQTFKVLQRLTHSKMVECDIRTKKNLLQMTLVSRLSKLFFANFSDSSYGGSYFIKKMRNRMFSHCLLKSIQKEYFTDIYIPWHNGIRHMILKSFNSVFQNSYYYPFLLMVALNPNPFRWIFDYSKKFSEISMTIEDEVKNMRWSPSLGNKKYMIYCQSSFVKERIIFYINAILYGNYGENGSIHDFLERLVSELDLRDPPQDDFKICLRPPKSDV
jgi:hypothetical protein